MQEGREVVMKDSRGCLPPSLGASHVSVQAAAWGRPPSGLAGVEKLRRGSNMDAFLIGNTRTREARDVLKEGVAVSAPRLSGASVCEDRRCVM